MHHDGHTTNGGCTKCVINRRLIAAMTQLLSTAAKTADEVRTIVGGSFDGCEHAVQLSKMAAEILVDIHDMVGGKEYTP